MPIEMSHNVPLITFSKGQCCALVMHCDDMMLAPIVQRHFRTYNIKLNYRSCCTDKHKHIFLKHSTMSIQFVHKSKDKYKYEYMSVPKLLMHTINAQINKICISQVCCVTIRCVEHLLPSVQCTRATPGKRSLANRTRVINTCHKSSCVQ